MSAAAAILEAILENPAEDSTRFALADLLCESDDPADCARGRFLWAGVAAAQFRTEAIIDDPLYYAALREIAEVVEEGYLPRWLGELGIEAGQMEGGNWGWDCVHDRVTVRCGPTSGIYSRGMLNELEIGLAEWYLVAPSVLAQTPLEHVAIADFAGLSFTFDRADAAWRLSARLKVPPRRTAFMGGPMPISVAPVPYLMDEAADWRVEELFPSRAERRNRSVETCSSLLKDLLEVAGNRWPARRELRRK